MNLNIEIIRQYLSDKIANLQILIIICNFTSRF